MLVANYQGFALAFVMFVALCSVVIHTRRFRCAMEARLQILFRTLAEIREQISRLSEPRQ